MRKLAERLDREGHRPTQVRDLAIQAVRVLYGRQVAGETDAFALDLPLPTAWVLARALSGEPARGFRSCSEMLEMLVPERRPATLTVSPPGPGRRSLSWALRAGILLVAMLMVAGAGWLSRKEGARPVSGPELLVASGTAIRGGSQRVWEAGEPVGAIACDASCLYVSLPRSGRVARLELATGNLRRSLAVGPGAGSLVADPRGRWLAVAFPRARMVRVWQLSEHPRPAAALGLKGAPRALSTAGDLLFVKLEPAGVEALSLPALGPVAGARDLPDFRDPSTAWWPGP